MNELIGIVVSHGPFASALVDAAGEITGNVDGLVAISNDGCTSETLAARIETERGDARAVVFVDMPAGSCLHAALHAKGHCPESDVAVVAGVNLAMLIDFCFHRDQSPAAAAERAATKGIEAIKAVS